jgi:hypothetical protein
LLTGTLSGTEINVVDKVNEFYDGFEKFSKITSTGLLVQDNLAPGYDPVYTNITTSGITIQSVSDIASIEKSELKSTQLAITNTTTSKIYTFGITGPQCQIDSSADNLVLNSGLLILNNIPTSNPGISGAVWNDGGFLKIVS